MFPKRYSTISKVILLVQLPTAKLFPFIFLIYDKRTQTLRDVSTRILLFIAPLQVAKSQKKKVFAASNGAITIDFQQKHYVMLQYAYREKTGNFCLICLDYPIAFHLFVNEYFFFEIDDSNTIWSKKSRVTGAIVDCCDIIPTTYLKPFKLLFYTGKCLFP